MSIYLLIVFTLSALSVTSAEKPDVTLSTLLNDAVNYQTAYVPKTGFPGLWSSYDRSGGKFDDQGFIRKEGGIYVIAEMMGPGTISRIWMKNPKGKIEIFVDEGGKPALSIPASDFFKGTLKPFTKPWVFQDKQNNTGYSLIPIPYNRFCKITATELFQYEIEYSTYPTQTKVEPFTLPISNTHLSIQNKLSNLLNTKGSPPFQVDKTYVEDAYAFTVPAAETVNFATFTGPAVIRGIQLQWDQRSDDSGRDLTLLMYWDHHPEPAVRVPVHDFFGGDNQTWLLGINNANEGYCYFPMPFQEQARLVIRNDNLKDEIPIHITVFVQSTKTHENPLRRFHAGWSHHTPAARLTPVKYNPIRNTPISKYEENITFFESNATGHLAAMTFTYNPISSSNTFHKTSAGMRQLSLYGSGIHAFLNAPSGSHSHPFGGVSTNRSGTTTASRTFFPTPFSFDTYTRFTLESGQANLYPQYVSACVMWYQEEQNQPYPPLPPAPARRNQITHVRKPIYTLESNLLVPFGIMESESADVTVSGGVYEPQDMSPYGTDWSQNQQLRFDAFMEGAELKIAMPDIEYSGWYTLNGLFTRFPEGGIAAIRLQERSIQPDLDLYSETIQPYPYQSGKPIFFHAGESLTFTLELTGSHKDAKGLSAGIDYIELTAQPHIPTQIAINGPVYLTKKQSLQEIHYEQSNDLLPYPVGYANNITPKDISTNINNKTMDSKTLTSMIEDKEGYYIVSFQAAAEFSGIYRFEIESDNMTVSTLQQNQNTFVVLHDSIWINGIALPTEERRFWDVKKNTFMPLRFSIPLQKGTNTISWIIKGTEASAFTPHLYGLQP